MCMPTQIQLNTVEVMEIEPESDVPSTPGRKVAVTMAATKYAAASRFRQSMKYCENVVLGWSGRAGSGRTGPITSSYTEPFGKRRNHPASMCAWSITARLLSSLTVPPRTLRGVVGNQRQCQASTWDEDAPHRW